MLFATIVFIAFFVGCLLGYLAGVWMQGNKDKQDVYDASYEITKCVCDIADQVDSEEWRKGALRCNKMYQEHFLKIFYGPKLD